MLFHNHILCDKDKRISHEYKEADKIKEGVSKYKTAIIILCHPEHCSG
jgi:hypothetical protein